MWQNITAPPHQPNRELRFGSLTCQVCQQPMSNPTALQTALRGLGIDPQAELERYHRACRASSLVPVAPPPASPAPLPEDYLASSEQLLQRVAASEPPTALPHQPRRHRIGPLAIAGAVMTAIAVGILAFGLQRRASVPAIATQPQDEPSPASLMPIPYLAGDAGIPLNAATLAQIETKTPTSAEPAAQPKAEKVPGPISARPDLSANYFYVTLEYSRANLQGVRQWVPDAYLVKFPIGDRIQAGAFYRRDQAEEFAQQLQQRGLPARTYKPE